MRMVLPSYYNPAVVNPVKPAEQGEKRRHYSKAREKGTIQCLLKYRVKLNFENKNQNIQFRKVNDIVSEDEVGESWADNEGSPKTKQQEEVRLTLEHGVRSADPTPLPT